MKNVIKYCMVVVFLLFFYQYANAISYFYPYVCKSGDCYRTELDGLNPDLRGYFMNEVAVGQIDNFTKYLNNKIWEIENYYGNERFTIKNFCKASNEDCKNLDNSSNDNNKNIVYDNHLNLSELLSIHTKFNVMETKRNNRGFEIKEEFSDGKDYLFANFTKTINDLHEDFIGSAKNTLISAIHSNIYFYDNRNDKFVFKNVCENNDCYETNFEKVGYDNSRKIKFITGRVMPNYHFIRNNFELDDSLNNNGVKASFLKAGKDIPFEFAFRDYLDASREITTYKFKIGFQNNRMVNWNYFFTGTINIDQDFNLSSPDILGLENQEIGNIEDIIEVDVLDESTKYIRIRIMQSPVIMKAGDITFRLMVKNMNTGENILDPIINKDFPTTVIPSDNIGDESTITIPDFNLSDNSDGYNIGDTFNVTLNLKDEYGNQHFDNISGYNIELAGNHSEDIKLAKYGEAEYQGQKLIGVESAEDYPYKVNFRMTIKESGYHNFEGFLVKIRKKRDKTNYLEPEKYTTFRFTPPDNFYNNGVLRRIFIKSSSESDLELSCTNDQIVVSSNCMDDNLSGCASDQNQTITFNSEQDNGKEGRLTIQDNAYNQRSFNYWVNHIDKTPPEISIERENNVLVDGDTYSYKAETKDLNIELEEWTPAECGYQINYNIYFGGKRIKSGLVNKSKKNITINNFFSNATYAMKKLKIEVQDKYGNSTTSSINIAIYPNHPGLGTNGSNDLNNLPTNSVSNLTNINFISENRNSLFSNNHDEYIYEAKIKDDMGNTIKNKRVYEIKQSCNGDSNCKKLYNDMPSKSNGNAITARLIDANTGEDGFIRFSLKSKVPGIFDERFKIKLDFWDNDYNNLDKYDFIFKNSNSNGFKRPFYGEFYTTLDNFERKDLQIGQEYYFNLDIKHSTGIDKNNFDDYRIISFANETYPQDSSTFVLTNIGTDKYKSNIVSPEKVYFTGTFNYIGNSGEEIGNGKLITSPIIEYRIDGQKVRYHIGDSAKAANKTLSIGDKKLMGVKIIGQSQGKGRQAIYGMAENASSMSDSKIRNNLIKKATELTQGMDSGERNKGVIYKKGDSQISNINYKKNDTIIIKNGNLIIDENINKKIGIMLIRDEIDNTEIANVLIEPNVNYINAIIFAQGGLKSNTNLNSELNEQLVIEGTLITWNTIGGGILSSEGKYILPSGEKTSNLKKAREYDLNYLRRDVEWSSNNLNQNDYNEGNYGNPVIIKFDTELSINPPKGF